MALDTSEHYTDARHTRVYHRDSKDAKEQFIGQTQAIAPKEKLFDGLSIPQIIAGAAAAATSVALASHIGIAGSVVGAAISSVVTVVSSQVYRRFLTAGARRLKGPAPTPGVNNGYVSDYGYSKRAAQGFYDQKPARYGARVAPTKLQARAAAERAAMQRKVVMFSVAAAVLAVTLCAGIILLSTSGVGWGKRIDTLWPASTYTAEADAATDVVDTDATTSGDADTNSNQAQTDTSSDGAQGQSTSDASSTQTADSASQDNTASDSTNTGTDTSDSSTDSAQKSSSDSKTDATDTGADASSTDATSNTTGAK